MLCLGLVAYLFSFVLRADGIVLCIGEDGHVELEAAAQDMSCGVLAPQQDAGVVQAVLQRALDGEHCGTCKDIPLVLADFNEIANANTPVLTSQDPTLEKELFTATHLYSYPLSDLDASQEIPPISVDLYLLAAPRTTILLI